MKHHKCLPNNQAPTQREKKGNLLFVPLVCSTVRVGCCAGAEAMSGKEQGKKQPHIYTVVKINKANLLSVANWVKIHVDHLNNMIQTQHLSFLLNMFQMFTSSGFLAAEFKLKFQNDLYILGCYSDKHKVFKDNMFSSNKLQFIFSRHF